MKFKDKLKKYRLTNGYTQKEFAELTGFTRSVISELENDARKVTLNTIQRIANKTHTDVSDWIDEEDEDMNIVSLDGLKVVIEALINTGKIDKNGNMNSEAEKLAMKMLKEEVKIMVLQRHNKG